MNRHDGMLRRWQFVLPLLAWLAAWTVGRGVNASADCSGHWQADTTFFPNPWDWDANDSTGFAVAIDDDAVIVSAPGQDTPADMPGEVLLFGEYSDGWHRLPAYQPVPGDASGTYGYAIDLTGDRVIVGDRETAYFYQGLAGMDQHDFSEDGDPASAVAIDGDWAVVGVPYHHRTLDEYAEVGRIRIMHWNNDDGTWNWDIYDTFNGDFDDYSPSTKGQFDHFGISVAIDDDLIVVGSLTESESGTPFVGAAYVYRYNTGTLAWSPVDTLRASDGQEYDLFGYDVAICGDLIVVGAPGVDDASRESTGAAYVFRRGLGYQWSERQRLDVPDVGLSGAVFGQSVGVTDDLIVVGAPLHSHPDPYGTDESGSAYVFEYCSSGAGSEWQVTKEFIPDYPTIPGRQWFGWSVDIDADRLLVGEPGYSSAGGDGIAHLYERKFLLAEALDVFSEYWPEGSLIFDLFEGSGDSSCAGGTGRRGGIDVPVIWTENAPGVWASTDLSLGAPLSGRINRVGSSPAGELIAAGAIEGGDAREHATLWAWTGSTWQPTTLAQPGGTVSGEAASVLWLSDGTPAAVGSAVRSNGLPRAVVWIDSWAPRPLPGLMMSNEARANDLVRGDDDSTFAVVGWAATASGPRPAYWKLTTGNVEITPLPMLSGGGPGGKALDIALRPDGYVAVAGEARAADGELHPVIWTGNWDGSDSIAWQVNDLGLPDGAVSGRVTRLVNDPNAAVLMASGEANPESGPAFGLFARLGHCNSIVTNLGTLLSQQGQWQLRSATAIASTKRMAVSAVPADGTGVPARALILEPQPIPPWIQTDVPPQVTTEAPRASSAIRFANPFPGGATIEFSLAAPERVRLRVFDVRGRLVRTLMDAPAAGGTHQVRWMGDDDRGGRLVSGLYFVQLTRGRETSTHKLLLR